MMTKYIFVTGGVVSAIGKGVSAASIGLLMKMRGVSVQVVKFDPYLNVSASCLAPKEHGEVFICDDGSETDLDLGTYERITGIQVSGQNICTSGMIHQSIINEEREGKYLGETIQVIPHVTNKVQQLLCDLGEGQDIVVAEIGGTVGDLESEHFYHAIRDFRHKLREENVMIVHVAPILWLNTLGEFKSKPLQRSIRDLRQYGLEPDILLCRNLSRERSLPEKLLDKVSNMTGISREGVIEAPDVRSVYEVPILFYDRHVDDLISDRFKLRRTGVRIHKYRDLVEKYLNAEDMPSVTIGIVGKYTEASDAYLSLKEAIYHAGVANNYKVKIEWIDAEKIEEYATLRGAAKFFDGIDAVIVPGGFDQRGVEGKIRAIQYARERRIPFLGICLGLQCAVIEFSRNMCGLADANSVEFKKEGQNISDVVHFIPGMEHVRKKGGTLRLGAYDCSLSKDSIAYDVYNKKSISERHRHRYEVNNDYLELLSSKGLNVTGVHQDEKSSMELVEIMELERSIHPFFIGVQFHPEFKSRLGSPHPLFDNLVASAIKYVAEGHTS